MNNRIYTVNEAESIVSTILDDYKGGKNIDAMDAFYDRPNKGEIIDIIEKLMQILYPGYFWDQRYKRYNGRNHLATLIEDVMYRLHKQIMKVGKYSEATQEMTPEQLEEESYRLTVEFLKRIPQIRAYLETDLKAAYAGDPAAKNFDEIILAYPGMFAITVNRLAHELFLLGIPLIPRIMSEHAHSLTGIDIHPGATIGKYFFIDHGTGIVVGETTVIGDNVKIYQGVTLGALSTRGGQKLKGVRRHPTIEDDVTIYAGAAILGGETVIGKGSVIGSNCFITKPVAPGSRVSIKQQELFIKNPENEQAQTTSENW